MEEKICSSCGIAKAITEFSPKGHGRLNVRCKRCVADHWLRTQSPYKDRYQGELPPVIPGRHRFAGGRTPDLTLPQYQRTETPSAGVKYTRANPDKRAAHKAVEIAILRGDLTRQPCERCGSARSHAHHDDYSKPLDVKWLCGKHHIERHRELDPQYRHGPKPRRERTARLAA